VKTLKVNFASPSELTRFLTADRWARLAVRRSARNRSQRSWIWLALVAAVAANHSDVPGLTTTAQVDAALRQNAVLVNGKQMVWLR
jgi:hypothetical protein